MDSRKEKEEKKQGLWAGIKQKGTKEDRHRENRKGGRKDSKKRDKDKN